MTLYSNRIAFLAPVDQVEACNRAANAWGLSGQNFRIRFSSDGQEPATHLGGSTQETTAFLAVVSAAPGLPEGTGPEDWPPGLSPDDWQAVADHLVMVSGPAATTNARDQLDALLSDQGLKRIQSGVGSS